MALDEKVVYCQVDAHLDSNPKIRKAGNAGRQVFEFLLRRVAIGHTEGTVPVKYIEPWYLADQLMMEGDDREVTAGNGVSRAVTANLITVDTAAGVVRVVGWSPEWGRRPRTNAERQSAFKERKRAELDAPVTGNNGESRQVTDGNESNVREEKRRDIGGHSRKRSPVPSRKVAVPEDWRPEAVDPNDETELVRFRNHHRAKGNRFVDIGLAWENWRTGKFTGGKPQGPGNGVGGIRATRML